MPKHQSPTAGESTAVVKRAKAASTKQNPAMDPASQNPFAVFTEWTGEADEKAYADL